MPDAAIAFDFFQTLDVAKEIALQIAFNGKTALFDCCSKGVSLFLGQIIHSGVRIDFDLFEYFVGARTANAVNIG